jgi:single-strand DNA-binding protein
MWKGEIIGNLGVDPQDRFTQKGTRIVEFRVGVNQKKRFPDADQETEATEWFRVRLTETRAPAWVMEAAAKLTKGQRAYVSGRFEIERFTKNDGSPGYALVMWADEIHAMGAPKAPQPQPAVDSGPPPVAAMSSSARPPSEDELQDLPF